ncbi:MAG: LamG-like jellyroll fold domain-containing protein [Phycisphaerae bacterium]
MCRKLIYLVSFILVLGLVGTSAAQDVDPSLVGWWKFDEGAGSTAADSSGNGNHGALNGPVEWVDGYYGKALSFTGPYNYVLVQDSPSLNPTREITIAAWINPSWTGNNRILQKSSGQGDNQYRLLKEWGDNLRLDLPGVGLLQVTGNLPTFGEWTHLAATYDGSSMKIYYNAVVVGEMAASGDMSTSTGTLCIGTKHETAPAGDEFRGMLDDVRIYNRALSQSEIKRLGGNPKASNPAPADRAIHEDTWANISWTAGAFATSHDVYFGDYLTDVKGGVEAAFQGNQTETFIIVGFPGFLYPDGLVSGTTYYWRIDEVNDANLDSPWKGDVWRFTVPPKTAWKPSPPDNAQLVDPNADLSWTPGWGGRTHSVYFGDNFDDVNNAAGAAPQLTTGYELDTLELGKTYYWRVDEFDGTNTYKGNVWKFTTGDVRVGGIKAEYFNNLNLIGTPVLTRIEPGIDYVWPGSPGPLVEEDDFSVRWTGELTVPFTETYTFYAYVQGGVRLSVDGQLIIDSWMVHPMDMEYRGNIDLEVGMCPIVMEFSDWQWDAGETALAQLSWSNPSLEKVIIPQLVLSLPDRATRMKPSNGAVDVRQTPILKWTAGDNAASHQVYFGTDQEAVRNADTASPEYKGTKDLGSESLDPGILEWDTTYYWRVDEVNDANPDSPWTGAVWSFTTANFPVVDDFENYDGGENQIWYAWKDGLGYAVHPTEPPYPGNGTGSAVGIDTTASFTEEVIVHGGRQSMPFAYDNSTLNYSEAELTLSYPTDWTEKGVNTLTIWFRGELDNAAEPMYVALNGSAVVTHDNPNAAQIAIWTEWTIDLSAPGGFADQGVDLTSVNTIALGFGDKNNPQPGGSGTMFFDDIALH